MPDLYNLVRPDCFEKVIGQNGTITLLKRFLDQGNFPQALLLVAPTGCGKTTIARILRNELQCGPLDYEEANAADQRGIDDVRAIGQWVRYAPQKEEGARLYVLDEVHQLTQPAQHAFLKILEDVPSSSHFILCTTDPSSLLPTLLNRCHICKLRPFTQKQTLLLLQRACEGLRCSVPDEEVLTAIHENSAGSPRAILNLLEQVLPFETLEEQIRVVQQVELEKNARDLARLLCSQQATWDEVRKLVGLLRKEPPENIRLAVLGYAAKVLLGGGRGSERAYRIMVCFEKPWHYLGHNGLVMAVYEAYHGVA